MRAPPSTETGRDHLRALFRRESPVINGYVVVRTGSAAVAEDIVADVFVAAARHCARGRAHEVTGAWLQTVAHRRLVDHWRRATTHRRLTDRLRNERPAVQGAYGDADDDRLTVALDSLPDRQRAALCLRYVDEFSVAEVADALDLSYPATESLLARARRSFATAYGDLP